MNGDRDHLLLKYLSGEITKEEQAELFLWLDASPENRKEFEDFENIWKSTAVEKDQTDFKTEKEWVKLENVLHTIDSKKSASFLWLKIAAAVLVLVIAGFVTYLISFNENTEFITTQDDTIDLVLDDGSHVWLNEHSSLEYSSQFTDKARTAKLTGEAFFDIQRDSLRPFIITTQELRIEVLGTSFNVKTAGTLDKASVTVTSGVVDVSLHNLSAPPVRLEAGEIAVFDRTQRSLDKRANEDNNITAWKTRRLKFEGTALKDVIKTLNDYFKTTITIKNPELSHCRFTSSFQNPTLQEVIEALSISLDLTITQHEDRYTIEGKGC